MRLPCSTGRWLLALLLLLPVLLGAKADVDGYKGIRWGSYLTDLQQTKKLVLTKEGGKSGASLYALENEDLRFGKATLTAIQYSFTKERLGGVILLFSGAKNFAAVKTEALAKYGESKKIEVGGDEMYNWAGANSTMVLSYNPKTQAGFLFLKPKKMPPPVKMAVKKPTAPADMETALDRAPPPKVPETRPTTRPEDMETALDRAPPLPSQPTVERFSPEVEALIDRDLALTQLCWETIGPAADAACEEMRINIERLKTLGLCAVPDANGPSGTETVWQRCGMPTVASPRPVTQFEPQTTVQVAPSQAYPESAPYAAAPYSAPQSQADPALDRLCRKIGELFAAAAGMRDNGVEPRVAEEELTWYITDEHPGITIERIRETVELVYFDQTYSDARGDQLADQVRQSCLNKRGPYAHPLP